MLSTLAATLLLWLPLAAPGATQGYRAPGENADIGSGWGQGRERSPERYPGPGDAAPHGAGPAPMTPPAAPAEPERGGPAAAPPSPGPPPSSLIPRNSPVGDEAWWTWWQLHRLDYLRPNLLRRWVETLTGYAGDGTHPARELQRVRDELEPALQADLRSERGEVRAAAAVALGRIAGADAVAALVPLLADGDLYVRERAILALGATGSREGAALLVRLARHGALDERSGAVTSDAQALAVFALSIGRRNGMGPEVDDEVARLAKGLDGSSDALLVAGVLMYQTLNPSPELSGWVLARATDPETPYAVRCRALETLRTRADDEAFDVLVAALGKAHLELRRSAALALGEFAHSGATGALLGALAHEREPLTRGFLLISIGRQGGDEARAFLLAQLAQGQKALRSWCALGLGILAREADDDLLRAALREGLERERNRAARGAYYLALGIAGDARAADLLAQGLIEDGTPLNRAVAAVGLAMIDSPRTHALLLERLEAERSAVTRASIAQALGYAGDSRDTPPLLAFLRGLADPELQSETALALGLHGTRRSLEGLLAVCADARATPSTRAAAIEALQIVLGLQPSLTVGELLRQANFSVFPPTLVRLRAVPL